MRVGGLRDGELDVAIVGAGATGTYAASWSGWTAGRRIALSGRSGQAASLPTAHSTGSRAIDFLGRRDRVGQGLIDGRGPVESRLA